MSLVEGIAALFGFVCVWLTVRQNIWCWPVGIIQVFLYIFVFYYARLYSDMLLQIIYIPISVFGWYHWNQRNLGEVTLKISLTGKFIWIWVIGCVIGTIGLGFLMSHYTNASLPYPDSFITIASLLAQWLMAKKKLESWVLWILVDVIAVVVYCLKSLYFTTGLYVAFLILATIGYFEWRKTYLAYNKLILRTVE
jgi:nicotinamide mononucleotide transporter